MYYASTIFQALGFQSGEKATLASLGIGIAKVNLQFLITLRGIAYNVQVSSCNGNRKESNEMLNIC